MPSELLPRFVEAITRIYVGYQGSSDSYARKNFYSNGAAPYIKEMFESFNSETTDCFVDVVKTDMTFRCQISEKGQLNRLRTGKYSAWKRNCKCRRRKLLREALWWRWNRKVFYKSPSKTKKQLNRSSTRALWDKAVQTTHLDVLINDRCRMLALATIGRQQAWKTLPTLMNERSTPI